MNSPKLVVLITLTLTHTIFYLLFLIISPFIHAESPINLLEINPWWEIFVNKGEGNELIFMIVFSALYFFSQYYVAKATRKISITFNKRQLIIIGLFILLATSFLFIRTNQQIPFHLTPHVNLTVQLATILLPTVFIYLSLKIYSTNSSPKIKKHYTYFLLLIITVIILLFAYEPHLWDLDYTLAPSLKLLQGEALGTYYMQYSLALNLFIAALLKYNFHLNQISFTLSLVFVLWLAMHLYIAKKLIKNSQLIFLYISSVFIFRYLIHIPVSLQTTSLRLDLWILILIPTLKYGLKSYPAALSVGLVYALDNHFGLLYAVIYTTTLLFYTVQDFQPKTLPKIVSTARSIAPYTIPIATAAAFNLYVFHSLTSQGAHIYSTVKLGFTPISSLSLFWLVLPALAAFLLHSITNIRSNTYLLIFGFSAVQLTYFFGRSYDINIINISSILLLMLYIYINDQNLTKKRLDISIALISIMLISSCFFLSKYIATRTAYVQNLLTQKSLIINHPFDKLINQYPHPFKADTSNEKILIIGAYDGYLNYRYSVKQQGYFAPFWANLYQEDTVKFIENKINNGYKIYFLKGDYHDLFFYKGEFEQYLLDFNKSNYLQEKHLEFKINYLQNNLFNEALLTAK